MKRTCKKMMALLLSFVIILSFAITALAADVTAGQAEEIALKDAGFSRGEVLFSQTTVDYENGVKVYEVEFFVTSNTSVTEYDYDILAANGKILSKEIDVKTTAQPATGMDIGEEKAKEIALAAFGLSADDVTFVKIKKDRDDGTLIYEIEFCKGYETKYEVEVNAYTGEINDIEIEQVRGGIDKIETILEMILNWLKSIFFFLK